MVVIGKYRLQKKLATGGMAEVFLAKAQGPMGFQKTVVLKLILPHFCDNPSFRSMFLEEARLAAELNHPNLVQVFDFGEEQGRLFIAMEYIDGPNLRTLNQAARAQGAPVPCPLIARIGALAAEGLHHAHELRDEAGALRRLVHRDVSPDNVLVAMNGAVKVVDFGIAKATNQSLRTRTGAIKGKLAYMPPEQLRREVLDRRTDVYALGVVLYELLIGALPYDATSEVSVIQAVLDAKPFDPCTAFRSDIPPALADVVGRCLEKDRDRRYASCRELQADLEAYLRACGAVAGTGELAAYLAQVLHGADAITSESAVPPSGERLATTPSRPRPSAPPVHEADPDDDAPQADARPALLGETGSGFSDTALRQIPASTAELIQQSAPARGAPSTPSPSEAQLIRLGVRRGGLLVGALAAGAALLGGGLVAYLLRPVTSSSAHTTVEGAILDAGPQALDVAQATPRAPSPGGSPPPVEPSPQALRDAGGEAAVAFAPSSGLDAGRPLPEATSGPASPPSSAEPLRHAAPPKQAPVVTVLASPKKPPRTEGAGARTGRLELRVRPYGTVWINDERIGQTPLDVQTLPAGRHVVRLVNEQQGKTVELPVVIKPGELYVLRHNFTLQD